MPKVFISHSSLDREFIENEIVRPMSASGIDLWYSNDDISASDRWQNHLQNGLRQCDWFLVVLSPRSVDSKWVSREVSWAINERDDHIVPVIMEDCDWSELNLFLEGYQNIDYRGDREQARRELLGIWNQPTAEATGWENLPSAERSDIERLLKLVSSGHFGKLRNAPLTVSRKVSSPLHSAVWLFCQSVVESKDHLTGRNPTSLKRCIAEALSRLSGPPNFYLDFVEVLRPAVLGYMNALMMAAIPSLHEPILHAFDNFATGANDDTLSREVMNQRK